VNILQLGVCLHDHRRKDHGGKDPGRIALALQPC
jgi:hypothetical protein